MRLPDGFTPVTFAEFDRQYPEMVREVVAALAPAVRPEDLSSRAVRDARAAVRGMSDDCPPERRLIQFARAATGEPAAFTAPQALFDQFQLVAQDAKMTARRVADGIVAWFARSGHYDAATGRAELKGAQQVRQMQTIMTPDGPLAMIRPSAEKLLKEGVISGTLDGDLHAADAATVKAALMASAVCDFCSTPGASHYYDVPDFGITTDPRGGTNYSPMVGSSTGGWMACDACDALIRADRRKALTERALATHAFPKFSKRAIDDLYAKFWQGMDERTDALGAARAIAGFVEDTLPEARVKITDRDRRVEAMRRMTGLTPEQVEQAARGELDRAIVAKLAAWKKAYRLDTLDPRAMLDLLDDTKPRPPLFGAVPHWQAALDGKYAAQRSLTEMLAKVARNATAPGMSDARRALVGLGFEADAKLLRSADAYSFSAETAAAIREAATTIPRDAPLSSVETPTGAGWFWFAEPLALSASPLASDRVDALLWGWSQAGGTKRLTIDEATMARFSDEDRAMIRRLSAFDSSVAHSDQLIDAFKRAGITAEELERMTSTDGEPAITFSAYVVDVAGKIAPETRGVPMPSTRWTWPLSASFDEMLAGVREEHRRTYGPGSRLAFDETLVSEEKTLEVVGELSLFFLMACVWFRQTVPGQPRKKVEPVLTRTDGEMKPLERHRLKTKYGVEGRPTVQVVALRKAERVPAEPGEPGATRDGAREYHWRWIVKGHNRLQACGPGRKDRKLIWIDTFIKGPDGKPIKQRDRVYAVVR